MPGELLTTAIIYPFKSKRESEAVNILVNLVQKYRIEIIALGNGTACRETESFLSHLIEQGQFKPMNVSYCFVSECGASVYSVTEKAKAEFANLDPNLISAVSIGRRLQDPLLELYKIEPKHIGVGMYQHDLDAGLLKGAVDGVVEDCVSFVGVDLNACAADMLRYVSGITEKQAKAIIAYRNQNGVFINREELKNVKGVGAVTFKNCAGFVRILPQEKEIKSEDELFSTTGKRKSTFDDTKIPRKKQKLSKQKEYKENPLDRTWIHPESYHIANGLLDHIGCTPDMIGSEKLKQIINERTSDRLQLDELIRRFESDEQTLQLIINGLQQPSDYDIRSELEKPSFKTGVTKIDQLKVNQRVTGFVRNKTTFGVFIDIGVSTDGLMHKKSIPPNVELGPGDRIECSIESVDVSRNRIGLRYERKLSGELKLR